MAKKNTLRKQVAALEALAGLSDLTPEEAKKANGGMAKKKPAKKSKKTTGALVARGTGALWAGFGTGALVARGSGALRVAPGFGG